ncbi:MAG: UDP-N-acetylglucosamine 2-epimerase (non-hydrolyzing) [Ignavibacteria bacterium]|nr:UDP-N-acetylglucosamine 2-epimerase (non-hydrolyzing) [Ignavibacteria bacterium]
MKKILTVIGARPQFIKCAPASKVIRKYFKEVLVHTGQHYDHEMSRAFFEELNIPEPNFDLGIGSDSHSAQTAKMLIALEKVVEKIKPDLMMVYGDTNSTLAGSLVASKLMIPLAHVEAGLRSYNRNMPEEINRICSDRISDILFCPTRTAKENLENEGIKKNVYMVGDVMKDLILHTVRSKNFKKRILENTLFNKGPFCYLTIHRQENTDDVVRFKKIFSLIGNIKYKVIFPMHPRTRKQIHKNKIKMPANVCITKPISYFESLAFQMNAEFVITDSGGMQKEAYILGTPCITIRDETEWTETLKNGFNKLVGIDKKKFMSTVDKCITLKLKPNDNLFGHGDASEKITKVIRKYLC